MAIQRGDFIRVAADKWHFEHALTGEFFVPIGCNYFPQGIGWAPKVWTQFRPDAFSKDFPLMAEMGMNVIRVFLSFAPFMPEEKQLSDEMMAKVGRLLDTAAEHDIRVIFSGPSAWEGTPEWATALKRTWSEYFTDEQVLENLEYFWIHFGKAYGDHPAIFAYDLCNEPHIVWELPSRRTAWIAYLKERYGDLATLNEAWEGAGVRVESWDEINVPPDKSDLNNPVIWDYQLFKNEISRRFIDLCVRSIRTCDKNHMITVGAHQGTVPFDGSSPGRYFGFDPHYVGDLLDYISIHWYPYDENLDIADDPANFEKNMALLMASLKYVYAGKPVVLEEFGLYGGGVAPDFPWRKPFKYLSQEVQAEWVLGVIQRSKGFCSGWLNWGFRDYPGAGDPTRFQGFIDDDGNLKELGKRFPEVAQSVRRWVTANGRQAGAQRMPLDVKALVTDGRRAAQFRQEVMRRFMESTGIEFDHLRRMV